MKKIISVLLFMAGMSTLYSQAGETLFGIQASPSIGWMRSTDNLINSNGVKIGLRIGGIGEHYLTDWMIMYGGAGFSFSQGGALLHKFGGNLLPKSDLSDAKYNTGEKPLPNDVEITYSLQMLEIPMGLRYQIGLPNQRYDLYLSFPEFYLGLISKSTGKIDATGIRLTKEDIGNDVKPFNFGWGVGIGIQMPGARGHGLTMGLHLQRGLSDTTRNDGRTVLDNGTTEKEDSKGTLNALILRFVHFF
ncbi:MAG: PorT family protein [Saprospiraceae bacterium]|nr:PorT family protein [Saprospiraceae bacterium]